MGMERPDIFALILALAAVPAGAALMAAPLKFENMSALMVDVCFYGGIALATVLVLVAIAIVAHGDRTISAIGMVAGALVFLICAGWYFWPARDASKETTETAKTPAIPISITELKQPGYARFSGLDKNDAENDPPLLGIPDVYISNVSLNRAVTLRIYLVIKDKSGKKTKLDSEGRGPFGRTLGENDFATEIYKKNNITPVRPLLSPITLPAQNTVHGDIPFIVRPFGFGQPINDHILEYYALGAGLAPPEEGSNTR